jgi:hypothetical protein
MSASVIHHRDELTWPLGYKHLALEIKTGVGSGFDNPAHAPSLPWGGPTGPHAASETVRLSPDKEVENPASDSPAAPA